MHKRSIKHNDELLSAYGNNAEILVREGQSVRGGKEIARLAKQSSDPVELHFEIRRNRIPVDPLLYLTGESR